MPDVVGEWAGLIDGATNRPPHGMPADGDWEVAELRDDGVTLRFDFPEGHDIERLERRIDGVQGQPALELSLVITARRPTRTSVGLHPIVRLPDRPRALRLQADFDTGFTYPSPVPPGRSQVVPARRFSHLHEVLTFAGVEDFAHVPFGEPAEEVVQLAGMQGPVRAVFDDEAAGVEIDWDRSILPSVQLWLSDRALQDEPWGGRYRGLGIEPIASAFDLAEAVSTASNPISAAGYATAVDVRPGDPLRIGYSLKGFLQK
ncbi:hypothetical protein G3T36_02590 [Diaminobutyricibacter tongyongensis]|uniref:Uncharacterized protein n=1 Tax=Leifsonia tongyongensis TaxID=1268043 RepID=A0A6L9XUQ2_9MICO|nr:hypothetical protein [Diaminobutyricibacter tongyongensis]NEN04748.1 hypothetical protein [Diaminobutyricibacter tongyongensis]